jgi:acyl-CoA dehydrogenase
MADATFLEWPFFDDGHRRLAGRLHGDAAAIARPHEGAHGDAAVARDIWQQLCARGYTREIFGGERDGPPARIDLRTLALMRESLAYHTGIADVALSEPWLAGLPIALAGTPEQRERWLAPIVAGRCVPAFALSEPGAGTDVAAIESRAEPDGDGWRIRATKTWTSNAGVADLYVVFAKITGGDGSRAISAFLVPGDDPGIELVGRIAVLPPHAVGTLRFDCRVPGGALLGAPGQGMALALRALELFRPTVGAATLGFARRALDEALARALSRVAFGHRLAEYQLIQKKLAEMAVGIDRAALLVYRACWMHDVARVPIAREAAMAKLAATEIAQRVVDEAVQIFGASGVVKGVPVERMYREVRAFRIFDGASDIQKLIIARHVLASEPAHHA